MDEPKRFIDSSDHSSAELGARKAAVDGIVRLLPLLTLVAFAGCCCTYGHVRVGDPEVFTREHLVGQRVRDHEWARNQLDEVKNASPTFAGLRDVSVFTGFADK